MFTDRFNSGGTGELKLGLCIVTGQSGGCGFSERNRCGRLLCMDTQNIRINSFGSVNRRILGRENLLEWFTHFNSVNIAF